MGNSEKREHEPQAGKLQAGKLQEHKTQKRVVIFLVIAALLLIFAPLFLMRGAQFGGSDDAGSSMVSEITGKDYQPWFTPVLEQALHGELPSEMESLFFCIQTGIGVGVIAFFMGRFVERKKWEDRLKLSSRDDNLQDEDSKDGKALV